MKRDSTISVTKGESETGQVEAKCNRDKEEMEPLYEDGICESQAQYGFDLSYS